MCFQTANMSLRSSAPVNYIEWKPDESVVNFFEKLRRKRDLPGSIGISQNENIVKITGVPTTQNSVDQFPSPEQHKKKDIPKVNEKQYQVSAATQIKKTRSTYRDRKKVTLEKKIAEAWL